MVHVCEKGGKELKVGCVYEIVQQATFDTETQEWQDVAHAMNHSDVSHLGGPDALGELMWAEAQARGGEKASQTQTIGAGAKWIWNLADEHFFLSQRPVDWYHATQHLHETAQLLHPDRPQSTLTRGYNAAETLLFPGQAETIAQQMEILRSRYAMVP